MPRRFHIWFAKCGIRSLSARTEFYKNDVGTGVADQNPGSGAF